MTPTQPDAPKLQLGSGLDFAALYERSGLQRIDALFLDWLDQHQAGIAQRLRAARQSEITSDFDKSELLIAIAACLDPFLAEIFGIPDAHQALLDRHRASQDVLRVKWKFVKRKAVLGLDSAKLRHFQPDQARDMLRQDGADPDDEPGFARAVLAWQANNSDTGAAEKLERARQYSAWAATEPDGQRRHREGVLFSLPELLEPDRLLHDIDQHVSAPIRSIRIRPDAIARRQGFAAHRKTAGLLKAMDEARYCLKCHRSGKDSCSHGLSRPGQPTHETQASASQSPEFARSAKGVALSGCPLDQRISEFLALKHALAPIGSLAMITLDNPMLAATGERICNECSKACIFQQQTPVDIPAAETAVLRDVLGLPWGVEIYSLLTRWNPLDLRRPYPLAASGRQVLVVGTGPAGFTLAHHLLQDGHGVVLIDGLRIEPLAAGLGGADASGKPRPFEPVLSFQALCEPLQSRIAGGFGGVAEYGITSRWDKNFLTLVRILLERRDGLSLYGSVRFGGNLDFDSAWSLGFDHVALALGAGRPSLPSLRQTLAPGIRLASDFLMALHSSGAARADSLANLQLQLPAVVIGGGLTAVDTATELLAYYTVQVTRFAQRHRALVARNGERAARTGWTAEESALADTFLRHADELDAELDRAQRARQAPCYAELLTAWGGVTIAYRRALTDSPAYRLNHDELQQALAQGVQFLEHFEADAFETDPATGVSAVIGHGPDASTHRLPARAVLIAIGTQPNTVLADEAPDILKLGGAHFLAFDEDGNSAQATPDAPKSNAPPMLAWRDGAGRTVSFLGDLHPSYAGSVVRAMASAKRAAPLINRWLASRPAHQPSADPLRERLDAQLRCRVERVVRLAPRIVEIVIHAPAAARAFRPGQFFRLQDFEHQAPLIERDGVSSRAAIEALALTGAWADPASGLLGAVVLELGASSELAGRLLPGTPLALMGPTGSPTEIPAGETVMLVGGGLGNAVLFSIGRAMRAAGCRVIYFAAYRDAGSIFRPEDIEASADVVIWCCETPPSRRPLRAQDHRFSGRVDAAIDAALAGGFGRLDPGPADCDRLLTIGSDAMMAAIARACSSRWQTQLKPGIRLLASINSPMQCMMKAICAQCVQTQTDPETGDERYVFSCQQQDQPLDRVDFPVLAGRLGQNSLLEKQAQAWIAPE